MEPAHNETQHEQTQTGSTQQEELMKLLASGLNLLQIQTDQLPEMLQNAGTAVLNSVKNMSTSKKLIGASVVGLGAYLLLRNTKGKSSKKK